MRANAWMVLGFALLLFSTNAGAMMTFGKTLDTNFPESAAVRVSGVLGFLGLGLVGLGVVLALRAQRGRPVEEPFGPPDA